MTPLFPTPDSPGLDLRERRRLETSAAIGDATLDLFETRGVEHTTVADIAAAAGISVRTFFRYFPSKEAAAVDGQPVFGPVMRDLLTSLTPEKPLLPQIEGAFHAVLVELEQYGGAVHRQLIRVRTLMLENGSLRAASLRYEDENDRALAAEIAARYPLPGGASEAWIAVHLATFTLRTAFDSWVQQVDDSDRETLADTHTRLVDARNALVAGSANAR
ncbi:TetR family transcriptional regulator [Mycetocola tolaasinivorans]|uniref:TetR family transcriptional regulator n=1 Tax=Mycetocola tolaasinivorans TaxID=76635 RepID=UPI0015FF42A0|nr:TetR family transcriptional regulator [Mycetocola tolaasinivorans]